MLSNFFLTSCWLSIKVLHRKTVEICRVFINQKYPNIEQHFLSLKHYKRMEKQIVLLTNLTFDF